MKTLIVYAGTAGATEKCAHLLGKKIGDSKVMNLDTQIPEIHGYETVILGSNIHMGHFHKQAKNFMNAHHEELKDKKHAFFISNAFPEQAEAFFVQNVPQELLSTAVCVASFGGELDITKLRGMNKFVAKMVTNANKGDESKIPKILEDRIDTFVETLEKV